MIWSPPIKLSFFCLRGNDFSVRLGLRDVAGLRDGLVLGLVAWPSGTGLETVCCLGCGSSLGTGGLGAWPSA